MPIPPARYPHPFGWSWDFSLLLEPHLPWFRILGTPYLKARQPRCSNPALVAPTEQSSKNPNTIRWKGSKQTAG